MSESGAVSFTLSGQEFRLSSDDVRASLAGTHPLAIREYWVEIDGVGWPVKQVLSMATGLDRSRFQTSDGRRLLPKWGFTVNRQARGRSRSTAVGPARPPAGGLRIHRSADVVLIGCSKTKLRHGAAAKDLYASDYFAKMRRYTESTGAPWFILSAEHGLVAPDQWLEPYDRYLPRTSVSYRRAWGRRVADQLRSAVPEIDRRAVEIHAGAAYVDSLAPALHALGADLQDPLRGLSIGRRLGWYLRHTQSDALKVEAVTSRLLEPSRAMSLNDFKERGRRDFAMPGMYSWWVDSSGADDLSDGLGFPIEPGLVYAGLAGATRTGGAPSTNTLWGRIATMHLGRRHQLSTLRLSIGSVLAEASGVVGIDEPELTLWMIRHLRVLPVPVADAETLGDLETEVLTALDPPLNLAKVQRTPLRQRLTALRKSHGGQQRLGEDR